MSSSLMNLAHETEQATQMPMPPVLFGVIAFAILMFLLLVTMAYRNVHTRRR